MSLLEQLRHSLIVSCQAEEGFPLNSPDHLVALAETAVLGGASAIRASDPANISAMRAALTVPIIGIYKQDYSGFAVRITPTMAEVDAIVAAGSDIIALDATKRPRPDGQSFAQLYRAIRARHDVLIMADVATLEEGIAAADLGVDVVSTTLSGYTEYSPKQAGPDINLVRALSEAIRVPVVAEGRIGSPDDVASAIAAGAHAVVVGSAITRPHLITRRFRRGLPRSTDAPPVLVLDIGGTKIAGAVVRAGDQVANLLRKPTPTHDPEAIATTCVELLQDLRSQVVGKPELIGVSSAGQIDRHGHIVHATDHITNWAGFPLKQRIADGLDLPVVVINDGHAAALGEATHGAGRGKDSVLVIVIGTGLGGAYIDNGRLLHGSNGLAGSIGQLQVTQDGQHYRPLEDLVSGSGLVTLYQQQPDAQRAIRAGLQVSELAAQGDPIALAAIREMGRLLGLGLSHMLHAHDVEQVLVGGGVAALGGLLLDPARASLAEFGVPTIANTPIELAQLGEQANLIGAAVFAHQEL